LRCVKRSAHFESQNGAFTSIPPQANSPFGTVAPAAQAKHGQRPLKKRAAIARATRAEVRGMHFAQNRIFSHLDVCYSQLHLLTQVVGGKTVPGKRARARVCGLETASTSCRLISKPECITETVLLTRCNRQTHYDMLIRCAPCASRATEYSFLRFQRRIRLARNQLEGVMSTLLRLSTLAGIESCPFGTTHSFRIIPGPQR
jgi:hypothetical protein